MGRVVCELLSTQICGPRDMNQFDLIGGAIYFIPLLISAKLDERRSGFGGMRYTSVYVVHCQGSISHLEQTELISIAEWTSIFIQSTVKDHPIINHTDINVKVD